MQEHLLLIRDMALEIFPFCRQPSVLAPAWWITPNQSFLTQMLSLAKAWPLAKYNISIISFALQILPPDTMTVLEQTPYKKKWEPSSPPTGKKQHHILFFQGEQKVYNQPSWSDFHGRSLFFSQVSLHFTCLSVYFHFNKFCGFLLAVHLAFEFFPTEQDKNLVTESPHSLTLCLTFEFFLAE